MDDTQTRRGFCGSACRALSLAALGGAFASVLESCGASGSSPTSGSSLASLPRLTANASGGSIVLTVDASSPLANAGSAALLQYQGGYLLIGRTADTTFTALSAICTHQACLINSRAGQAYFCGCHGSEFDTNGRVLLGPAVLPLAQYATQYDATKKTLTIAV
jgi:cytochrome b6-f complex iron-sulfur subunit